MEQAIREIKELLDATVLSKSARIRELEEELARIQERLQEETGRRTKLEESRLVLENTLAEVTEKLLKEREHGREMTASLAASRTEREEALRALTASRLEMDSLTSMRERLERELVRIKSESTRWQQGAERLRQEKQLLVENQELAQRELRETLASLLEAGKQAKTRQEELESLVRRLQEDNAAMQRKCQEADQVLSEVRQVLAGAAEPPPGGTR